MSRMFEAFHGREQILHHLKYFRMKLIVNVPALDDAELPSYPECLH